MNALHLATKLQLNTEGISIVDTLVLKRFERTAKLKFWLSYNEKTKRIEE